MKIIFDKDDLLNLTKKQGYELLSNYGFVEPYVTSEFNSEGEVVVNFSSTKDLSKNVTHVLDIPNNDND